MTAAPAQPPAREPSPSRSADVPGARRIALLGNPNTGKTTLFNRLTGLRHKTANFPGTTQEARVARVLEPGRRARAARQDCCGQDQTGAEGGAPADGPVLVDLPGVYSLELEQTEAALCREVLAGRLAPRGEAAAEPDTVCIVADATNLERSLLLVGEALRRRLPTVVALNMIDLAQHARVSIDAPALARQLGCPVVACSARTGEGLDDLRAALAGGGTLPRTPPGDRDALRDWADALAREVRTVAPRTHDPDDATDRVDRVLTHPVLGTLAFGAVMGALFFVIFQVATYPMDWIDAIFAALGGAITDTLPAGMLTDLLAQGVVGGIGATVIFVPQIALLFFLIALLEDTGYLARAALVMDRALRPLGLSGHAFVPLLSAHACALPGIMACRAIPDRRERLAAILVAPFLTCSARLPVYVLATSLLFRERPALAALALVGCYALGIAAAALSALVARRTILRGPARAMALELPTYRLPSLRTALATTLERAWVFLRNAGTTILAICVALWWLGAFPHVDPPAGAVDLRAQAAGVAAESPAQAATLEQEADRLEAAHAKAQSFAGRLGRAVQPVFAPLGYDWQLTVGVLSSFAAREVFVSTMAVVVAGDEDVEDEGVLEAVASARRTDGSPVFTTAVAWSLLVFYVLAIQCLPTLAVTAREAGGARWALLQFAWMSGVAYLAALLTYQVLLAVGVS